MKLLLVWQLLELVKERPGTLSSFLTILQQLSDQTERHTYFQSFRDICFFKKQQKKLMLLHAANSSFTTD